MEEDKSNNNSQKTFKSNVIKVIKLLQIIIVDKNTKYKKKYRKKNFLRKKKKW